MSISSLPMPMHHWLSSNQEDALVRSGNKQTDREQQQKHAPKVIEPSSMILSAIIFPVCKIFACLYQSDCFETDFVLVYGLSQTLNFSVLWSFECSASVLWFVCQWVEIEWYNCEVYELNTLFLFLASMWRQVNREYNILFSFCFTHKET